MIMTIAAVGRLKAGPEREMADRYLERRGAGVQPPHDVDSLVFYYAFGLLKTAVIAQQIYYRFAKGLTTDARFAAMIMGVRLLAEQARTAIEKNAI